MFLNIKKNVNVVFYRKIKQTLTCEYVQGSKDGLLHLLVESKTFCNWKKANNVQSNCKKTYAKQIRTNQDRIDAI